MNRLTFYSNKYLNSATTFCMDFTNVTKSFEMTSILKYRNENLKTADIETLKTKTQKNGNLVLQENR